MYSPESCTSGEPHPARVGLIKSIGLLDTIGMYRKTCFFSYAHLSMYVKIY